MLSCVQGKESTCEEEVRSGRTTSVKGDPDDQRAVSVSGRGEASSQNNDDDDKDDDEDRLDNAKLYLLFFFFDHVPKENY